jgi:hypothetical protein
MMKALKIAALMLPALFVQASAIAKESLYTAHIAADGKVLRQSPQWIKTVKLISQPNYYSEYKLALDPAHWKNAPGFCSASPIDASDYDRLLHGSAKVNGAPTTRNLTVITQLVDLKGPSGNNDMEFLVLCTR